MNCQDCGVQQIIKQVLLEYENKDIFYARESLENRILKYINDYKALSAVQKLKIILNLHL